MGNLHEILTSGGKTKAAHFDEVQNTLYQGLINKAKYAAYSNNTSFDVFIEKNRRSVKAMVNIDSDNGSRLYNLLGKYFAGIREYNEHGIQQ